MLLGACTGGSQTTGQSGPSPDPAPTPTEDEPSVADFETFDPARYEARPPERTVEVQHRVPARLMRSHAERGMRRTIEGFRIQVFSARDQQAAQDFRERVRRWWENNKEKEPPSALGDDPPIIIKYSQPYYRVRIGAFADRGGAEDALSFVTTEYPNAFISRGTVTVTE